ncbi:hypothetical protein BB560_002930 [Smittium megazygosporum]|uniref:ribonuclease T2 n=1 Tax=Smittium megazygosporum TaxID=133381 RepID=A0A2T9ZDH8_9FUNG|nr:hypothetical protein BB560_002930 [Smittium megazygosporum]
MKSLWPSNQGDDNRFWTHEWNKHGTCVSTIEPKCYDPDTFTKGLDVADYFKTVLDLVDKYPIYQILKSNNIVPTDVVKGKPKTLYELAQFKEAVEKELGYAPTVHCVGQRLNELRLYFFVKNKSEFILTPPQARDTCRRIAYNKKAVR